MTRNARPSDRPGDRSTAGQRGRQHGFTLIELMVALLISSLLVGMILAIFSRMSLAYRGQQQIAGVQQVLAAARATIELDAKQAGLGLPQGFKTAFSGPIWSPVRVSNGSPGPDQIAFFYADTTTQAMVRSSSGWPTSLDVDAAAGFSPKDLIVITTVDTSTPNPLPGPSGLANIATYTACVMQIDPAPGSVTAGPPGVIRISSASPWGWGGTGDGPCPGRPGPGMMVYRFVAHGYKIDSSTPARATLGPLQGSQTGGLLGNNEVWTDLAYGFSDIQTALRVYDNASSDLDGDGDPNRNWYSGTQQNTWAGSAQLAPVALLQMTISLVAHTDREVEGIATSQTPNLVDPARPLDFNAIGDRPSVALPVAPVPGPDPWPDPLLPGLRIYRYTTFQIDFRNLGIGQ